MGILDPVEALSHSTSRIKGIFCKCIRIWDHMQGRRAQKHGRFTWTVNTGCFGNEDVSVNQQRALLQDLPWMNIPHFMRMLFHTTTLSLIDRRKWGLSCDVLVIPAPLTSTGKCQRGTGQGNHFLMPSLFNREVSEVFLYLSESSVHLGISYFTNLKAIWDGFSKNKPWFQSTSSFMALLTLYMSISQ